MYQEMGQGSPPPRTRPPEAAAPPSYGEPGFFYPYWMLDQSWIPVACISWWGLQIFVTLLNYLIFIRTDEAEVLYGAGLQRAYVAFVVIGMIAFFTVASTCWFWAMRYVQDRVDRKRKIILGIVMCFFFNDMPLWAIDYRTIELSGAEEGSQVASFVFKTLTFLTGGIVVWLTYTYKITTFLHYSYTPPPTLGGHTGSVFPERGGGLSVTPPRGRFGDIDV
eukprot:Sspe_Gene.104098::Locus_79980_Transcript_1_3_Confidence_0.500_Length_861::g.104098::m.104098